jgi:xylan 1,4-beta-xylosidase
MTTINNPILPGFNPDPSIVRVGDTYYIATSTFQWFPGVQIHSSRDLVNWELACRPLDSPALLDMRGVPDNGGIWAPCLSYADGKFWLLYTNVHSLTGIYKDTPNYLSTAESIEGPWTEPVYLNSSGFDPSLYHDEDGKKYLLNMVWDHRPWKNNPFYGIVIQEYSESEKKLIGKSSLIFKGSTLGCVEGPHLYKKDGYYYLFTAEGGTEIGHAETVARSRTLLGPYEIHPENPLISARDYPDCILQKTGHGDMVQTPEGEWYFVHLTSRPVLTGGHSFMGRETAIQKILWPEGEWPRLATGGNEPSDLVQAPSGNTAVQSPRKAIEHLQFDRGKLPAAFQFLRYADEKNYSLTAQPGVLRLYGRESMSSRLNQSLAGVRVDSPLFTAETTLDFQPESFLQSAGLSAYYDMSSYYYLQISFDEFRGRVLHLECCRHSDFEYPVYNISIPDKGSVSLKIVISKDVLQFYYSLDNQNWECIGPELSCDAISDEFENGLRFTGAFCALACQDLTGSGIEADFRELVLQRG